MYAWHNTPVIMPARGEQFGGQNATFGLHDIATPGNGDERHWSDHWQDAFNFKFPWFDKVVKTTECTDEDGDPVEENDENESYSYSYSYSYSCVEVETVVPGVLSQGKVKIGMRTGDPDDPYVFCEEITYEMLHNKTTEGGIFQNWIWSQRGTTGSGIGAGAEGQPAGERAKRASLFEDDHTRDEVREIATDGYI